MTATATGEPPEAVEQAFEQSFWGQVLGIVAFGGMSWAGVLDYPELNSLLGAAFLALYLGAVVNLLVVAARHPEAMR